VLREVHVRELPPLQWLGVPRGEALGLLLVADREPVLPSSTQAGKTTPPNTLGTAVPCRERIVSVEEVFELQNTSQNDIRRFSRRVRDLARLDRLSLRRRTVD